MLILTRQAGEGIVLEVPGVGQVLIVVGWKQSHQRSQVQLGIQAPREVLVERGELREKRERDATQKHELAQARPEPLMETT